MTVPILLLYVGSILTAAGLGRGAEVGAAFLDGARSALEFVLFLGGAICLWSAVMELLERSGAAAGLSRLLRPLLRRLYPRGGRDR